MTKFSERIVAAAQAAHTVDGGEYPYWQVAREFAIGLEKLEIGAKAIPGPHPQRMTVVVFPRGRPARGSVLLSLAAAGDHVRVLSGSGARLSSAEELEEWLIQLVRSADFLDTVSYLRQAASDPVDARLCVKSLAARTDGDIVVRLEATEQMKLADPETIFPIQILAERVEFGSNGRFDALTRYAILDSAGIPVEIAAVSGNDECLRIDCKGILSDSPRE